MRAFVLAVGLATALFHQQALAQTETNAWTGAIDRDWFEPGNWSLAAVPSSGQMVLITNPTPNAPLLTNATAPLAGLTLSNATLTCSNWFATVQADEMSILNKGAITLPWPFLYTNDLSGLFSNRVHIVCTNLLIETGGEINVNARGYLVSQGPGAAPSAGGSNVNGGGGHGGRGGDESTGRGGYEYGSTNAPETPGSGGARYASSAYPVTNGCGGGVVRIEADRVVVNGSILARGSTGLQYDGGGAGGSVYITCASFGGTNGTIRADGGEGGYSYSGGGGGGGRIALDYDALIDSPSVRFSTAPGRLYTANMAGMGTLHLPDLALVTPGTLSLFFENVRLVVPGWNAWAVDSLTLTSNSVCLGEEGFRLTVTNDLVVQSNGWLTVGAKALSARTALGFGARYATNPAVQVGGSLVLRGGILSLGGFEQESLSRLEVGGDLIFSNLLASQTGLLSVASGWTNVAEGLTNGGMIVVSGATWIGSNGWLNTVSHPTNGGSLLVRTGDLDIRPGGGVTADGSGFRSYPAVAYGPGAGLSSGSRGSGAGHGGIGGRGATTLGGPAYGDPHRPLDPGSGGGFGHSPQPGYGHGGGLIRLEAGNVTVDGLLSANGNNCVSSYGGGGSGGALFVMCDSFSGTGGLRANGGTGPVSLGGGGGGGRIAVAVGFTAGERAALLAGEPIDNLNTFTNWIDFTGVLQVSGGTGYSNGAPGTIAFLQVASSRSVFIFGTPGNYGAPGTIPTATSWTSPTAPGSPTASRRPPTRPTASAAPVSAGNST